MKKSVISLLFITIISCFLQAESLYVYDDYDSDIISSAVAIVKKSAASCGLQIVETDKTKPSNFISMSYGYDDLSDEELEQMDKEAVEKHNEDYKRYEAMGIIFENGNEYVSPYKKALDRRIAQRKQREDFKYPYLKIQLSYDAYDKYYSMTLNLSTSQYDEESINYYYNDTGLSKKEIIATTAVYLESIFPLVMEKSSKKLVKPVLIDCLDTSAYYGKELGKDSVNYQQSVAARDDNSFVVAEGNSLRSFEANGQLKNEMFNQMDIQMNTSGMGWQLYSDGTNIFTGNTLSSIVYEFNDSDILEQKHNYNFDPFTGYFYYDKSGNPYALALGGTSINLLKEDVPATNIKPLIPAYPFGLKNGTKNEIWVETSGDFFVACNTKGKVVKVVRPQKMGDGKLLYVTGSNNLMVGIYENTPQGLKITSINCYDSIGRLIWEMPLPSEIQDADIVEYRNGIFYLFSNNGKIWRYAASTKNLPKWMANVSRYNNEILQNPKKYENYVNIAEEYLSAGGYWQAYENYKKYLIHCPGNSAVNEKLLLTSIEMDKIIVREALEKTIDLYEEYGEETAKPEYQKGMKIVEKARKQVPWDTEINELYRNLKNVFGEEAKSEKIPSLKIKSVDLSVLFPALMNTYASNPSGIITVVNDSDKILKNVSVTTSVKKYMDFASKGSEIPEIKPGEEVMLDVYTVLNNEVLNVNENTNLQMLFTLSWTENNKNHTANITRTVTLYKKSAMSWIDTSMLSCFILPNDETVSGFAYEVLQDEKEQILSSNFSRAISLVNALGSLPVTYISDPVAPATDNIGNPYAIDTVRFPYETLIKKGGDCDDTTVLFCSVLESVGIPTALITTPGHIFAAFSTGMTNNIFWKNLDGKHTTFDFNKEIWIPIETTCLSEGFEKAWISASNIINETGDNVEEFIILSEKRGIYSPVDSNRKKSKIKLSKDKIARMNETELNALMANFTVYLDELCKTVSDAKDMNILSKIYYSFGNEEKAISLLEKAIQVDKNYSTGYNNLAIIYEASGNSEKASYYSRMANMNNKLKKNAKAENKKRSSEFSVMNLWEE